MTGNSSTRKKQRREQALAIWRAGVDAVASERLVTDAVRRFGNCLTVCGHEIDLNATGQLLVVGAGKAGAGMAAGIERAVGRDIPPGFLGGLVNVPADCVRPLEFITLHAARPAGVNEPTEAGVRGTEDILQRVAALGPKDVCLVLLSGGGSALLPAPAAGISLEDKQQVTRLLMHAGASIDELNLVRRNLSRVKGGGLARASNAGKTIGLVISDVIGDPLDVIASGPLLAGSGSRADALAVLERYVETDRIPPAVRSLLSQPAGETQTTDQVNGAGGEVSIHVIGNNAVALQAAAAKAEELGFAVRSLGSENRGVAREVGTELADLCLAVRNGNESPLPPCCVLSGGEPVVHLAQTDGPQVGGRNQELAVAALLRLADSSAEGITIVSGGTDGEDGPTDAAGGIADSMVLAEAARLSLNPADYLAVNNTLPFLEQTGGLIRTGPTHTNVMDLRVCLVTSADG
ncbi:MAG: DUF4147 domain-containing protein [Planctomycetaceae bacterium]|nr:DUF4147 domain-containing protein [Planctomycetaceae bacterium]